MRLLRRWRARAPRTQPGHFCPGRARLVEVGALVVFGVLATRAVMLSLLSAENEVLHAIAGNQYQRQIELAPYRGTIHDRKGEPLAISVRRPSLAVNPRIFDPKPEEVERLARILSMKPQAIRKIEGKKSYFAWLARQLDRRIADEALSLGLPGLVAITEPARFYTVGSAAAQLLGFVGLDNDGLAGLERQYDQALRGKPHKVLARKDARGQFIFDETGGAAPEKMGHSLHLTLDRVIQEIVEDELEGGVRRARAKSGFAIVSDPHTGKVLAVANYPGFDPNQSRKLPLELTRNRAFSDVFEPGSVTKPFLISQAVDQGIARMDEPFDCEKGAMRIGKHTIRDDHPAPILTVQETIIRSSNICTFKIATRMGRDKAHDALASFGFGQGLTALGLPGMMTGRLSDPQKWAQIRFAATSFGYGFTVTGLELVQAMGAIANGGQLAVPSVVEKITSSDGIAETPQSTAPPTRILSPETARLMRETLKMVVTDPHGTASRAATKLYSVAGKTGTAKKADLRAGGYSKDKRIASFVGFAPFEDPHLVVYVMIDEPGEKPYYGGLWAAPVFSGIVERSLRYLNVAPDLPNLAGAATGHGKTHKM